MKQEREKPKTDITSKIIVSFVLVILLMGISIIWILQKRLGKILTKAGIEQTIVTEINSAYLITSVGVSIIIIILAIFIAYFISKNITNPIKELTKASTEIKKGNLSYKIKVTSKDEIGELVETFNKMRLGLKDRNQLLNTILNAFKGKVGGIAAILLRKNIQELSDKNPRVLSIIPKSLADSLKKEKESEKKQQ